MRSESQGWRSFVYFKFPLFCLYLWVMHKCSLVNFFTIFHPVPPPSPFWHFLFLKILFIFRERTKEGERRRNIDVREKRQSLYALTGDRTRNPGMCPDWESHWGPFAVQNNAQPTEPHCSGLPLVLNVSLPHSLPVILCFATCISLVVF